MPHQFLRAHRTGRDENRIGFIHSPGMETGLPQQPLANGFRLAG